MFLLIFLFASSSATCTCYGKLGMQCNGIIKTQHLQNCTEALRLIAINATFDYCNPHLEYFPNLKQIDLTQTSQLCTCMECKGIPLRVRIKGCYKCENEHKANLAKRTRNQQIIPREVFRDNYDYTSQFKHDTSQITDAITQMVACLDRQLAIAGVVGIWMRVIIVITSTILLTMIPMLAIKINKYCKSGYLRAWHLGDMNHHRDDGNNLPFGRR